jgi:hypothetical protein
MKCVSLLRAIACFLLLTGCAPTIPYHQPVEAGTPLQFNTWRAKVGADLTQEEWQWFDLAMQEFKFQLMLDQTVSGRDAIDVAVRERINGRRLVDVVREGLQAHLKRKTAERDELEAAIAINSKRKIRPDDTTMLQDLANHQENLRRKLAKLNDELAAANAALDRLATKTAT